MPDGKVVTVHNQLTRAPEILFKPSIDGKSMMGLHELLKRSIDDCGPDLRKSLLANIICTGGTSAFPGFTERLQGEIEGLCYEGAPVKVSGFEVRIPDPLWRDKLHAMNMSSRCPGIPASRLGVHLRERVAQFVPNRHLARLQPRITSDGSVVPGSAMAAMVGGTIFAELSTYRNTCMKISADPADVGHGSPAYDEVGPRLVHMMCNQ